MSVQNQKNQELANYQRLKANFLDSLQPDDLRNGGTFNQAEAIIDQLSKALYRAAKNQENTEEFINKSVSNLFREDSSMATKAADLLKSYLKIDN